jgi:hypothetical protein
MDSTGINKIPIPIITKLMMPPTHKNGVRSTAIFLVFRLRITPTTASIIIAKAIVAFQLPIKSANEYKF